jgi:hypothetical protein
MAAMKAQKRRQKAMLKDALRDARELVETFEALEGLVNAAQLVVQAFREGKLTDVEVGSLKEAAENCIDLGMTLDMDGEK